MHKMPLQLEDYHTNKHSSGPNAPHRTLECSSALRTAPLEQEVQVVQQAFYSWRELPKGLTHHHNQFIISIDPLLLRWWSFCTWGLRSIIGWLCSIISNNLFTWLIRHRFRCIISFNHFSTKWLTWGPQVQNFVCLVWLTFHLSCIIATYLS